MCQNNYFHDHYELLNHDFKQHRLIVFTGKSGAGKSTYIKFLIENNISIKSSSKTIYAERPMQWGKINNKNDLLVLDELKTPLELYYIIKLLLRGNSLIIANHVAIFFIKTIGFFTTSILFNLDNQNEKICFYLKIHGYHFSQSIVEQFCNTYGSNYTDLEIILEHNIDKNFDTIYKNFMRYKTIEKIKVK